MRDLQPLTKYIQQSRGAGVSNEVIRDTLLQDGTWTEEEVLFVLKEDVGEPIAEPIHAKVKTNLIYKVMAIVLVLFILVIGMDYIIIDLEQQEVITSSQENNEPRSELEKDISASTSQIEPYSVARTLNVPYLCKYNIVSFWKELDYFEAQILGDDFYSAQVPSHQDLERQEKYGINPQAYTRFVKKDGWVYLWLKPQEESLGSAGYKFKYDEIENFIKSQDPLFSHFQYLGLLVEPSPDGVCDRIEAVRIVIPNLKFIDVTEKIKSGEVSFAPVVTISTGTVN